MDINQLQRAWKLASEKHYGQKYGGPQEGQEIEYIEHIGSVLLEVQNAIKNDQSIDVKRATLGAVFHDLLEDTDCEREVISLGYGQDVLDIVEALTKNETLPTKLDMMNDSLNKILNTYREAAIVKMADRISNLYSPPFYWNKERMIEYVVEAQLIHEQLSPSSEYLGERLMTKIEQYKIEHIQDHQQDYLYWAFNFTGSFSANNLNELIAALQAYYGAENVIHKTRIIGDQVTISHAAAKVWIEGHEEEKNAYRIEFEHDGFSKNTERLDFLKTLKKVLSQNTENVIFEYYFTNALAITDDYSI